MNSINSKLLNIYLQKHQALTEEYETKCKAKGYIYPAKIAYSKACRELWAEYKSKLIVEDSETFTKPLEDKEKRQESFRKEIKEKNELL